MEQDRYFTEGYHIDRYHILEKDLLEFLYYIPLDFYPTADARSHVTSPYLADMLIRIGSAIDIFFRNFIMKYPDIKEKSGIRVKFENDLNWNSYKALEPEIQLSQTNVGINHIIYGASLEPFWGEGKSSSRVKWNDEDLNRDKFWWDCYNKVKHNGQFEKANLENVMQALGAYIILISYQPHKKLQLYKYINIREKDPCRWMGPSIEDSY